MISYQVAGSINSAFIILSLYGIWAQLQKVWQRKQTLASGQVTAVLSLNQFSVSFFAYWSFFVYGYSIHPFNHFIVWPRLLAALLVLLVLVEIARDRQQFTNKLVAGIAASMLVVGLIGLLLTLYVGSGWQDQGKLISQTLIVVITCLLAQGYLHQIKLIVETGTTGAVSIRMSQFILMMDCSTLVFASTMAWQNAWPLVLLATVSAITKVVIMYLFYWVRTSPAAAFKRGC